MDGWVDGWLNGWIDEWMNGWMDGWMDRWMDGWTQNGGDVMQCEHFRTCLPDMAQSASVIHLLRKWNEAGTSPT
jgi:hypothetical protein